MAVSAWLIGGTKFVNYMEKISINNIAQCRYDTSSERKASDNLYQNAPDIYTYMPGAAP